MAHNQKRFWKLIIQVPGYRTHHVILKSSDSPKCHAAATGSNARSKMLKVSHHSQIMRPDRGDAGITTSGLPRNARCTDDADPTRFKGRSADSPGRKEILEVILPRGMIDDRTLLEIIKARHKARVSARVSHHRRSAASSSK